jgi:hypothetical protein
VHSLPEPTSTANFTSQETDRLRHAGQTAVEDLRHLVALRDELFDATADAATMLAQLIALHTRLREIADAAAGPARDVERQHRLRVELHARRQPLAERSHRCGYQHCPGHADPWTNCDAIPDRAPAGGAR